jgi:hypothetical protein
VNRTLAKSTENELRFLPIQSSEERYAPENNQSEYPAQTGEGYRGGQNGNSAAYGYGNRGKVRDTQQNSPIPQAQVDGWVTLEGEVASVEAELVVIYLSDGEIVEISGRPWSFIQENSYVIQPGDRVQLTGFYEDEVKFEIGSIENLSRGSLLQIRDQSGRPLWAGQGWQG